ncbi:hypothetical protein, partial [Streptomyces sp. NPDC058683]|uniref:hypothetical protein n=1 Tax=Streptomyces sp. NPDC058683 TaxID=3346597 RepID=UPI0036670B25
VRVFGLWGWLDICIGWLDRVRRGWFIGFSSLALRMLCHVCFATRGLGVFVCLLPSFKFG